MLNGSLEYAIVGQLFSHEQFGVVHSLIPPTYMLNIYYIEGNFQGRKISRILGFVAIRDSFLYTILGCGVLWHDKSEQSAKLSP